MSFGVPSHKRMSYFVWREGKPPAVVREFGPPLSVNGDAALKKEAYRRMGVREYWLVNPVGEYHDPRVQGFELVGGKYEPLPWTRGPDSMVAVWSPLLKLEQRFADGRLRFWDREIGRCLELPEEEYSRLRLEEEQAWLEAQRARQMEKRSWLEEKRGRLEAQARAESGTGSRGREASEEGA